MSRIKCLCGEILSNSTNPNIEYKLFSDNEWIEFLDRAEKEPAINIDTDKYSLWKCPKCQRIYIFEEYNDNPQIYKLEVDNGIKW